MEKHDADEAVKAVDSLLKRLPERVHVYIVREPEGWIAHLVEFDIVGEGDSGQAAFREMADLLGQYLASALELDEVDGHIPRPAPRSVVAELRMKVLLARVRRYLPWDGNPPSTRSVLPREALPSLMHHRPRPV